MDLSKLSTGDKVIVISGIALLVFSFFSWFEGTVQLGSADVSAGTKSAWGVPSGSSASSWASRSQPSRSCRPSASSSRTASPARGWR